MWLLDNRTQAPSGAGYALENRIVMSKVIPELNKKTYRKRLSPYFSQLQQTVDRWIRTTGVRYYDELTNMAILTEEVGEVARVMSRAYGEQSFKKGESRKKLADELADVLFVLTCIANQTGVDLTKAVKKNIDKKTKRDARRHKENPKLK